MPVETTRWDRSFKEAWEMGLEQVRALPDWEKRVRVVSESWLTYPPADPPFDFSIDEGVVRQTCDSTTVVAQVGMLDDVKRTFVQQEYEEVLKQRPDDAELYFELAYVYISMDMMLDARVQVNRAARLSGDTARAETYLGNSYFMEGDLVQAVRHYRLAAEFDPGDSGLKANLERAIKKLLEENRKGGGGL